ncbi:unnamed protein product [Rotaria socialis]|uniref:Uncharacterized protein n=1 Tax=Rotaria socialis TaxID=392032 RepID=A0A821Q1S4_9BILA|nr:unnamed protein product [Rotaria socialis]CAF3327182.1 unnamed protein product [Rotaria socialis]CAF3353698.1 unnamed protein product [Rotaria socialis]CAF3418122.1 unnamed protein product [Rotaria socialis]CAF4382258.1 unnamed protein product [Rotaria socialis]
MSNLETLNLSLSILVKQAFIDGYNLRNKIVNRMPRVNKFTFDIHPIMSIQNDIVIPSNEDIRNTFNDFQYTQSICYMDHFPDRKECRSHVYTYPSQMSYYQFISNQFPGGYGAVLVRMFRLWSGNHQQYMLLKVASSQQYAYVFADLFIASIDIANGTIVELISMPIFFWISLYSPH